MSKRVRYYGAILSLVAFSAFFAESVWAATCDPDMGSTMAHGAAAASAEPAAPGGMPVHDHAAHPDPAPAGNGGDDAASCPLVMAGAGGCVSSTLGAAAGTVRFPPPQSHLTRLGAVAHAELLVALTLFHPPRA
jgi:hypothetical protein